MLPFHFYSPAGPIKFTLAFLMSKLLKGSKPKQPTALVSSSSLTGAQAPTEVSTIEAQPIQAVGLEEGRPVGVSYFEGAIPSDEVVELEVLTALMKEEEDVVEMSMLQCTKKQQRSPKPMAKATEV